MRDIFIVCCCLFVVTVVVVVGAGDIVLFSLFVVFCF